MIKNYKIFKNFENELIKKEKTQIDKNFQILDEMYKYARELGIFPLLNPLDGIEIDIKIAKIINYQEK